MIGFVRDVRYAARALLRAPAFSLVAVVTLALGIAANAATFSVVGRVLLRPLPFPNAGQLVRLEAHDRHTGARDIGLSVPELDDLRASSTLFAGVSAIFPADVALSGTDHAMRVELLGTNANYFTLLGATPQLGRVFGPEDERRGFAEAVVISDGLWHRAFGGDPAVIGRKVRLDNDVYTIVGVMPPGFRHPGPTIGSETDVWATAGFKAAPFPPPQRAQRIRPGALARVRDGVSLANARQALDAMTATWQTQYGGDYPVRQGWSLEMVPLQESLVHDARPLLAVLMAAAVLILLIASVNVANLSLMRATGRQREVAARAALGASQWRLLRLLLTEALVLAVAAAALGLLLAAWGLPLLLRLAPVTLPRLNEVGVGWDAVGFTLAVAVVTGVLFGILPAMRASRVSPGLALKDGVRVAGGSRQSRLRRAFVVSELALSLVLLVGAGLLLRTFWQLVHTDPGFRAANLAVANIWMPVPNDPSTDRYGTVQARTIYIKEALRKAGELPSVDAVAMTTLLPLSGRSNRFNFSIEPRVDSASPQTGELISVTPGYFRTLGARLLAGRDFTAGDDLGKLDVAIVDRTTADRCWPGQDAIGKRLIALRGRTFTVVGIIADIKHDGLDADRLPHVYTSMFQLNAKVLSVIAHTQGGALPAGDLQATIEHLDPDVPTFGATTLSEVLDASLAPRRFAAFGVLLFAAMAMLLASLGLYGVIAYGVSQRTHELGVRMALGARALDVVMLLLAESAQVVAAGVGAGLVLAAAFARLLSRLLYGVGSTDGLVFLSAAVVLVLVAFAAATVPARRAGRVDPVLALRGE